MRCNGTTVVKDAMGGIVKELSQSSILLFQISVKRGWKYILAYMVSHWLITLIFLVPSFQWK